MTMIFAPRGRGDHFSFIYFGLLMYSLHVVWSEGTVLTAFLLTCMIRQVIVCTWCNQRHSTRMQCHHVLLHSISTALIFLLPLLLELSVRRYASILPTHVH